MKYLVFAVFSDGTNLATHSKEMDLGFKDVESSAEEIIESIADSGLGKETLWEVFVFKSAQNFGSAPEQVGYWNQEDGLFGLPDSFNEEGDEDE